MCNIAWLHVFVCVLKISNICMKIKRVVVVFVDCIQKTATSDGQSLSGVCRVTRTGLNFRVRGRFPIAWYPCKSYGVFCRRA